MSEQQGESSSSSSGGILHSNSPKKPAPIPLSPSSIGVAMSDSIVPTLANLSLEQQQQLDAAIPVSTASSPGASTPIPITVPTSSSSTSASDAAAATDDALLPAAPSAVSGSAANVSSSNSTSSSLPATTSTSAPAIKSRDFAAAASIMASAAATQPPSAAPTPTTSNAAAATAAPQATMTADPSSKPAIPQAASSSSLPSTATSPPPALSPSAPSSKPTPSSSSTRPGLPPSSSSSSAIRRPGVGGQGAGLAARIPPSLQAKMAAMASRSNNPTSLQFAQNTHIGASERIPTSAFLRHSSTGGPSSSSSPAPPSSSSGSATNSPMLAGQSGPGRPSPVPMSGGALGRVGSAGPMAMGGMRSSPAPGAGAGGLPGGLRLPGAGGGIAKRRGPAAGLNLGAMSGGAENGSTNGTDTPTTNGSTGGGINGRAGRPQMRLPTGNGAPGNNSNGAGGPIGGTPFSNFSKIVDPSGSLNFQNKAVLHAKGVDFSTGASFNINMDELELQDELGSGNYGTVQKVYHKITKVTMAMKEIRLELDDSKLKGIITELDVLHRATAPEIVEFYGAFFIESCVYYCMEYMDAGSLDKMSVIPVPEPVLQRVTASMVRGLKFLKDKLQIMHRDVKPTNVLINTAGMVKLCDFGVSGQLERSLAKTNIGCQSYMAPERIKGESQNFLGTYTVSSDVWSLGLSIVEFTLGRYPYPPETYSNVFAQLTAIVHGDPPCLPDGYSKNADDFVAACLQKDANKRPSYAQLLRHPFLANEETQDTDMVGWVKAALEKRAQMRNPPSSSAPTQPARPA